MIPKGSFWKITSVTEGQVDHQLPGEEGSPGAFGDVLCFCPFRSLRSGGQLPGLGRAGCQKSLGGKSQKIPVRSLCEPEGQIPWALFREVMGLEKVQGCHLDLLCRFWAELGVGTKAGLEAGSLV